MNSPHKLPVTRKMLPFDDVVMIPHRCLATYMDMPANCSAISSGNGLLSYVVNPFTEPVWTQILNVFEKLVIIIPHISPKNNGLERTRVDLKWHILCFYWLSSQWWFYCYPFCIVIYIDVHQLAVDIVFNMAFPLISIGIRVLRLVTCCDMYMTLKGTLAPDWIF